MRAPGARCLRANSRRANAYCASIRGFVPRLPAWWRIVIDGRWTTRNPAAFTRKQRSVSSEDMKKRSSSQPAASSASRRRSMNAPVSQSASVSRS